MIQLLLFQQVFMCMSRCAQGFPVWPSTVNFRHLLLLLSTATCQRSWKKCVGLCCVTSCPSPPAEANSPSTSSEMENPVCPMCHSHYNYSDGVHNFNNSLLMTLDLCLFLRANLVYIVDDLTFTISCFVLQMLDASVITTVSRVGHYEHS